MYNACFVCGRNYIFVLFYFQRGNKAHINIPSTVEPSSLLLETLHLPPISEFLRPKVANPLQQQPLTSSAHILQQKVGQPFDTNINFEPTAPASVTPIVAPMNYNITQDPATNASQDIVITQQLLNQLLANNGALVQLSEEEMSTQILQSNCKCEQIVPVLTDLTATFKVWSDRQLIFENEVRHFMATATGQIRSEKRRKTTKQNVHSNLSSASCNGSMISFNQWTKTTGQWQKTLSFSRTRLFVMR